MTWAKPYCQPLARVFFWLVLAAVVVLSLTPVEHLPPQVFSIWDKAQHALAFLALSLLGLWAYSRQPRRVLTGLLLLGAAIELAQAATGWRYGEWADLMADAVGVLAGAWMWRWISGRRTLKTD
ncbi:VanZ family protein [Hydrogenophaga aquatica]